MKKTLVLCAMLAALFCLMAFAGDIQNTAPSTNKLVVSTPATVEIKEMNTVAPDETQWTRAALEAEIRVMKSAGQDVTELQKLYDQLFGYPIEASRSLDACDDCLTPNIDLGTIGTTEWGYSVNGDCGIEGKWYAKFDGIAGDVYYWDLCADLPGYGTANFDADIKITDASCAILAGIDGSCSGSTYRPNNWMWTCTANGTYYVVVAPYRSYNQHNCAGTASNTFTLNYYRLPASPPPPNDLCVNAAAVAAFPASYTIDNTFATDDATGACGGSGNTMSAPCRGVWYKFVGDGYFYTASTCNMVGTLNDTKLQVWSGDCASLVCVGGDDDACDGVAGNSLRSVYTWCAESGITYYIHVGSYAYTCPGVGGTFGLDITRDGSCVDPIGRCCIPATQTCVDTTESRCAEYAGTWTFGMNCTANPCAWPPTNDHCDKAIALTIGVSVNVDNTAADTDVVPTCDDPEYPGSANGGVWYTVVGTGNTLTASTCGLYGTLSDTKIQIYSGDCLNLVCVGANEDDDCLEGSTLRAAYPWCSDLGVTYYIHVGSYSTTTRGTFPIVVLDDGIDCHVDCDTIPLCGVSDEVEPNDVCPAPETQTVIGCNTTVYGLHCPNSDMDWWKVVVPPMTKMFLNQYDGPGCTTTFPNVSIQTSAYYDDCTFGAGPSEYGWTLTNPTVDPWTLYILVNHFGDGPSPYKLEALCCDLVDYCLNPIIIPGTQHYISPTVNTCCATNSVPYVFDDGCAGTMYNCPGGDVVFQFTILTPGTVTITVSSLLGDAQIMVFTDCAGPDASCVASQDMTLDGEPEVIADLALAAGTYYLSVADWNTCDDFVVDIVSDVDLPVELTGTPTATAGDRAVTLNWTTASESNLDRYEIARDGHVVGTVDAANTPTGKSYSFTDEGLDNGTVYTYTLTVVNLDGSSNSLATLSATPEFGAGVVTAYALYQNYPNPFNPTTTLAFDLKDAGFVSLKIYNLMGQSVGTVVNHEMAAGRHTLSWDAANLPSGIYLYRLEVNGFAAEKKMLLMK